MTTDLERQRRLKLELRANVALWECLERLSSLNLPRWYLGAGCIAQTIWNSVHRKAPDADICDYDLVYFDADVSEEHERAVALAARRAVDDLQIKLDVKNQARVHLWYGSRFGFEIQPYRSLEDAISTWPTTATALGVRLVGAEFQVFAPFGLHDLFDLVIRANRIQITPEIYDAKAARWGLRWPLLRMLPWSEGIGVSGARHLEASTMEAHVAPADRRT